MTLCSTPDETSNRFFLHRMIRKTSIGGSCVPITQLLIPTRSYRDKTAMLWLVQRLQCVQLAMSALRPARRKNTTFVCCFGRGTRMQQIHDGGLQIHDLRRQKTNEFLSCYAMLTA